MNKKFGPKVPPNLNILEPKVPPNLKIDNNFTLPFNLDRKERQVTVLFPIPRSIWK